MEEGGVERSEDSNQQEINNQLAKLSVIACSRLIGGGKGENATPENLTIKDAMRAMLTPYIVKVLGNQPEQEILKVLNSNTENPYLVWNNGTRAELVEYLRTQQKEKIRSVSLC